MTTAPQRGAGDQQAEKRPRRVQPTKAHKKSTRDADRYSAPAPDNQASSSVRFDRGRESLFIGDAIVASKVRDEPHRFQKAAAIATQVLAQMGRLHTLSGGPGSDIQKCEVWFEIGLTQHMFIASSRPKWKLGVMAWARKYAAALFIARSEAWFRDRIREHRQDRRFFSSATMGTMLGVTLEHFWAGKLWHLWPAGMTAEQRRRLSLDNKAAWAREDRLLRNPGMTPRSEAMCNTNARLPGESRSAFYRRMTRERTLSEVGQFVDRIP